MDLTCSSYLKCIYQPGLFIGLAAIALACSEKKEAVETASNQSPSIVEPIKLDLNAKAEENFSSLFDSVGYMLLEHRDETPLVGNLKTVLSDQYIYIEDNELDNLFQYDHNGKLLRVFKSTGSGPGEFAQIEDFQIKNDTVIILDRVSAKLVYIDQFGKFIKEFVIREGATNFHIGSGHKLLFYSGYSGSDGKIFLRIAKDNTRTSFFPLPPNSTRGAVRLLHGLVADESTDMLSVTVPYTYDIAFIDSAGFLDRVKRLLFENIPPKRDDTPPRPDQPEKINVFFPFSEFYFITQFFNRLGYYFLFDRNFNLTYFGKNLKNDIDGMHPYLYPIAFHKDRLVLYFHSTTIYNSYKKKENNIKENYPNAAIHQFVRQHGEELQDDRHVLVFLKFKKDVGKEKK